MFSGIFFLSLLLTRSPPGQPRRLCGSPFLPLRAEAGRGPGEQGRAAAPLPLPQHQASCFALGAKNSIQGGVWSASGFPSRWLRSLLAHRAPALLYKLVVPNGETAQGVEKGLFVLEAGVTPYQGSALPRIGPQLRLHGASLSRPRRLPQVGPEAGLTGKVN